MTATWIAFEMLHPPHHVESVLWMASTGLMLTAAASDLAIMWYVARAHIEPVNDENFKVTMAYRAGYADGLAVPRNPGHFLTPVQDVNGRQPKVGGGL